MKRRILFFLLVNLLFLVGCQNDEKQFDTITLKSSSVEFGVKGDRENKDLHFHAHLQFNKVNGNADYKVKFLIDDPFLQDVMGVDSIVLPPINHTEDISTKIFGYELSESVKLKSIEDINKIKEKVESNRAISVEVYEDEKLIIKEKVDNFSENMKPIFTINPNITRTEINLKEKEEQDLLLLAFQQSIKNEATVYMASPNYLFKINQREYYVWFINERGWISDDLYSINELDSEALQAIKKIITKIHKHEI